VPLGQGGEHGPEDPTEGATGDYVYGYNLAGDYPNNLAEKHLTSKAIDCSHLYGVHLKFQRWLGVEQPDYDHAYVRVSTDETNWTTIWTNESEIADNGWQLIDLDISEVAANQQTVYLRWTMGATDGGWMYCGWNIDDVQVLGIEDMTTDISESPVVYPQFLGRNPNPFRTPTSIEYELNEDSHVSLIVYDLQGRMINTLVDAYQQAGINKVYWNGTDESGNYVSNGIYFCVLSGEGILLSKKLIYLKGNGK